MNARDVEFAGVVCNVQNIAEYCVRLFLELDNIKNAINKTWEEYIETYDERIGTILEVGCGYGRLAMGLLNMCVRYVGIDVRPNVIEIARKSYRDFPMFEFHVHDITKAPFPLDDVDVIFTNTCLQHIERYFDAIANIRKMKPKIVVLSECTHGLTSEGFIPRPVSAYAYAMSTDSIPAPRYKLVYVKSRKTLINGELRLRGAVMGFIRHE